jgi:Spy/CpxP family protein refolding chaperone
MKIKKISMAIIAASAVLAASPAVWAQAMDTNKPAGEAPARPRGGGPTLEAIDKAVTLTEAEKPKVKAALEAFTKAAQEARGGEQADMRAKMRTAREELDKKMKEILTPEQYTKYQAMPRRGGGRNGGGGGAGGGAAN